MAMDLEEYIKRRDKILMDLDIPAMIALLKETGSRTPATPEVAEMTMHKARTASTRLPMFARTLSKRWLLERGYKSLDDGDVPA